MEGDAVEGMLSGSIKSGLVRVGLGRPMGSRGVERTSIVNGYVGRIDLVGVFRSCMLAAAKHDGKHAQIDNGY